MLRDDSRSRLGIALAFLILSLLIYGGTIEHELLNWDDRSYVSNNPWVTNPNLENTLALFSQVRMANWHPLTWLSYIPEFAVCGDRAVCYKLTNALLHGLNAFLVYLLALFVVGRSESSLADPGDSNGTPAFDVPMRVGLLAGLLFLVHPQHVESVTWVAERKDLLCALFYFLALLSYCRSKRRAYWETYGLPLLFFVLAGLSKSMAVSLPVALVLFDLFLIHRGELREPNQALRVLVLEKLPFYGITIGLIVITLNSQSVGQMDPQTLAETLAICLSGVRYYLLTFLVPWGLSPFHPVELVQDELLLYLPILLPLILCGGALVIYRHQRYSSLLSLGLLFFLASIAPVIGIVKVGEQAFADRYSYIPMLGFYIATAWVCAGFALKRSRSIVVFASYMLIVLFFAWQSYEYKNSWRNDLTFWSRVVARYGDIASTPLVNLANSYTALGNYDAAEPLYRRAMAVDSGDIMTYINLASVQRATGNGAGALITLANGVQANPEAAGLMTQTGRAFLLAGDLERAEGYLQRAQQLRPDLADVKLNTGLLLLNQGQVGAAIERLATVPPEAPQHYEANLLLVQAWAQIDPSRARQALAAMRSRYGEVEQLERLAEQLQGN